ncbi:MAG: peptidase MA family metallohydrolase [bacterium]
MQTARLTFFAFSLSLHLCCSGLAAQAQWYTLESSLFRIRYHESDKKLIDDFSALVDKEYEYLTANLNLRIRQRVRIYLSPTQTDFDQITGHHIPHWGEGVALLDRNMIVLKSPNLTKNFGRLSKLVRHELTHILVSQAMTPPAAVPTWFHEGMAIYFSYDDEFIGGEAISKALIGDSIVPLAEIDHVLKFRQEKARLAYEESYSAVLFLEEKFGYEGILALTKELKNNKTFEGAFQAAYGISSADFELDWIRYAEKKYRWRFLLDFDTFLWIFMLVVFILVVVTIKIRNRIVLKRWEEEERLSLEDEG